MLRFTIGTNPRLLSCIVPSARTLVLNRPAARVVRWYSETPKTPATESRNVLVTKPPPKPLPPMVVKAAEAGRTASYGVFMLAGAAILGASGWYLLKAAFSGHSPENVYAKALEIVVADDRVKSVLGEPLKGTTSFQTEEGRYRRANLRYQQLKRGEQDCLKVVFFVVGQRASAEVHAEMMDTNGTWDFNYIVATIPRTYQRIILIDRFGLVDRGT